MYEQSFARTDRELSGGAEEGMKRQREGWKEGGRKGLPMMKQRGSFTLWVLQVIIAAFEIM